MASARLDLVHLAIRSGILGHIQWKLAAAELVRGDPLLAMLPPERICALLRQFVLDGNSLDVRSETREEYLAVDPDHPFWYRAVIPAVVFPQGIFVEVRLIDDDRRNRGSKLSVLTDNREQVVI